MSSTRPTKARRNRGFTILELGVAVVVLGLIAAISVPYFLDQQRRAQDAVAIAALRTIATHGRSVAWDPATGVYVFPGPGSDELIAEIRTKEASYKVTGPFSEDPNHVVTHRLEDRVAEYAALSKSGTCWYLFDFLAGHEVGFSVGFHYYSDTSPEAKTNCGREIPVSEIGVDPNLTPEDEDDIGLGAPPPAAPEDLFETYCQASCFIASAWGDPHMVTYDGLGYEFQTVGEYVATRTLAPGGEHSYLPFQVQIRTGNTDTNGRVSYVTGVAVQFGQGANADVVTITTDPDTPLRINGHSVELEDGAHYTFAGGVGSADWETGFVARNGNKYEVVAPGPEDMQEGRTVTEVWAGTNHIDLNIAITLDYAQRMEGLFGDADENLYNDLKADGATQPLEIPTSNYSIHTAYADSWAVATEQDSLFAANGAGYVARNEGHPDGYPAHYMADNPAPMFSGFDDEDIADALAACKADPDIHANLLEACAYDTLIAGGDLTLRNEARRGARGAAHPKLVNAYDEWMNISTYTDGVAPTGPWSAIRVDGSHTIFENNVFRIQNGADNEGSTGSNLPYAYGYRALGVVTPDFTFQADISVPGRQPGGHEGRYWGMLIADGANVWGVRVMPTSVTDLSEDSTAPTKMFVTNLWNRFAQIRIAKSGQVLKVYVDGHYAFDLDPITGNQSIINDLGGVSNRIAYGQLRAAYSQWGRALFDNVAYSTVNKEDRNMTIWSPTPEPWDQSLFFNDGLLPSYKGWKRTGQGATIGVEDGALYITDTHNHNSNRGEYTLYTTVSEDFVFQADVHAPGVDPFDPGAGRPTPGHNNDETGIKLSDGQRLWYLRFMPTSISDGNQPLGTPGAIHMTNLADRFAQIRVVKQGTTVKLYVDGTYAFDLAADTDSPGDNRIVIGQFGANHHSRLGYDNIRFTDDLAVGGMDNWSPNPWVQTLHFDDNKLPTQRGWIATGKNYTPDLSTGKAVITDNSTGASFESNHARFAMRNTVTNTFTVETEIQLADLVVGETNRGFTNTSFGLLVADGTSMWWARFLPDGVYDGNDSNAKVELDLKAEAARVAIVKNGAEAYLYVNNVLAFELTAAAAGSNGNQVSFGQIISLVGDPGRGNGVAIYDNVSIGPER